MGEEDVEVMDAPGIYSLLPIPEEEKVTMSILLQKSPVIIIHVVAAKNLERMLPLTLQLLETGLPLILILNIMDEAGRLGIRFDLSKLKKSLGIPVIAAVSTTGQGIGELKREIFEAAEGVHHIDLSYEGPIQELLGNLEALLEADYPVSTRSLAALLLQGDPEAAALVDEKEGDFSRIASLVDGAKRRFAHPISYELALERQRLASQLVREATQTSQGGGGRVGWSSSAAG